MPTATFLNYVAPRSITNTGTVALAASGAVKLGNHSGSAHFVVEVQGYYTASGAGASYVPVAPCRIADTRVGGGAPVEPGAVLTFQLSGASSSIGAQGGKVGGCGVPAGAVSAEVSVSAVGPTANGYARLWPSDGPPPNATFLNYSRGRSITNTGTVAVGVSGAVKLGNLGGSAHYVLDVQGYFTTTGAGAAYVSVEPCRIADTRAGNGPPVPPGSTESFVVAGGSATIGSQGGKAGACGVPAKATAVEASVSAVAPSAAGYTRAWADGGPPPNATFLNFAAQESITNTGTVGLSAAGAVSVGNYSASSHYVLDVQGYFIPSGKLPGNTFGATSVCQVPPQAEISHIQTISAGRYTQFSFAKYPDLGTIWFSYYIAATELHARAIKSLYNVTAGNIADVINGFDNGSDPDMRTVYGGTSPVPGFYGPGDDRGPSKFALPEKSRLYGMLDFRKGTGYVFANGSKAQIRVGATITKAFDAHTVYESRDFTEHAGANNWFHQDWMNSDTFRLRIHATNATPLANWTAGAIDSQLEINKRTNTVEVVGDSFPSVEVYQDIGCRTLKLRRENSDPNGLRDFTSSWKFPAAANANPTPIALPQPPSNTAPTAKFTATRRDGGRARVALDGRSSTDAEGNISAWRWFVDGTLVTSGPTAELDLGSFGTRNIALEVVDTSGATGRTSKSITFANRSPAMVSLAPNAKVVDSIQPTLRANAQDPDGDTLSYRYRVTGDQVDLDSGWTSPAWTVPASRLDPGQVYSWSAEAKDGSGASSGVASASFRVASLPTAADLISTPDGLGYWQTDTYGGVFTFGNAPFHGSVPGLGINVTNIMGMARTPSGQGYWVVGRDGGVYAFGDAPFHNSLPGQGVRVNNIVAMSPTPSGNGYWLVGSDGGVFAFGDAPFKGSLGGQHLNKPIVGMSVTPTGLGYWLAAADGGVFAFGDAQFYGSLGSTPLNAPVVDIDHSPDGGGYLMTAQDGGVFAFGNAEYHGSLADLHLNGHIVAISMTPNGGGYYLMGCDGGVFAFGNALFIGSNPTFQCRGT